MKRWLRVTLPHDGYVAAPLLLYAATEAITNWPRLVGAGEQRNLVGEMIVSLGVILYGFHRVVSFHPAARPDYRNWLRTTPWTSRHPLPVGPIHLVMQDVVVLGFILLLAWFRLPEISLPHLILKFLFAYELAQASSFGALRMPWFAYAIGFGLGLVTLLWDTPRPALGVAFAIYSISFAGLRRALGEFENWNLAWMDNQNFFSMSQEKMLDRLRQKILGWPFDYIRPRDVAASITFRDGAMLSLLAGWWLFVAMQRADPGQHRIIIGSVVVGFLCQLTIAIRLAVYCWGYFPPISIWGRIFTFRWIIPGYDKVFLAPLTTLGIAIAGTSAPHLLNVPIDVAAPLSFALIFFTALTMGPSLMAWRLTGKFRLSPAVLLANRQAEVKQVG